MTYVSAEIRIAAPKARVWDILANLGEVARFHPFVSKSYYHPTSARTGVGASRVCEFGPAMSVRETAVDWREGQSYVLGIEVVKGQKPPIRDFQGHLSVHEIPGGTLARIEMRYEPRFGPIGWLMDRLMIRPQYEKMLPGIMAGLKHHVETGEDVDPGVLKSIDQTALAGATAE